MRSITVFRMIRTLIDEYKLNSQWGTAHIYQSACNAFVAFRENVDLEFSELSQQVIKDFELCLRLRRCSWNTIATYMKVLRAAYYRAAENGMVAYCPRLFAHVNISVENKKKRSIPAGDMGRLIAPANAFCYPLEPELQRARLIFSLMFLLRGIPFVDLVFLRKSDYANGAITYHRRKTGRPITVKVCREALSIIKRLSADTPRTSPYLLPYITYPEGTAEAYKEYQRALRLINHRLDKLSRYISGKCRLSTYAARHTWATMAYYCEIHQGIISEAMGHSSIAVTENYLKPFRNERIDRANDMVLSYVKGKSVKKRQARKW